MTMTMMVLKTWKRMLRNAFHEKGRVSSTFDWSALNQFRMRPTGVVSKKLMGARRMEASMPSWRFLEIHSPSSACPRVRK